MAPRPLGLCCGDTHRPAVAHQHHGTSSFGHTTVSFAVGLLGLLTIEILLVIDGQLCPPQSQISIYSRYLQMMTSDDLHAWWEIHLHTVMLRGGSPGI